MAETNESGKSIVASINFGTMLLIIGIALFFIGFHNQDIGWNLKTINLMFNESLIDIGLDGTERTGTEGIQLGGIQIILGITFSIAGTFLHGFNSGKLYERK